MKSRPAPRALPSVVPGDCGRCRRPGLGISTTIPSSVCSSPFSRWSSRSTSLAWSNRPGHPEPEVVSENCCDCYKFILFGQRFAVQTECHRPPKFRVLKRRRIPVHDQIAADVVWRQLPSRAAITFVGNSRVSPPDLVEGFIAGNFDMTWPYTVRVPLLNDIRSQAPEAGGVKHLEALLHGSVIWRRGVEGIGGWARS